jgi:hypothetical protein
MSCVSRCARSTIGENSDTDATIGQHRLSVLQPLQPPPCHTTRSPRVTHQAARACATDSQTRQRACSLRLALIGVALVARHYRLEPPYCAASRVAREHMGCAITAVNRHVARRHRLLGRCRVSLYFLQLLKAVLAPSIDFGLLNPLAVRGLDVQGKLAPARRGRTRQEGRDLWKDTKKK